MAQDSYGPSIMNRVPEASQDQGAGPWREELRAMLALAWPLILANLTQQAIQATDI